MFKKNTVKVQELYSMGVSRPLEKSKKDDQSWEYIESLIEKGAKVKEDNIEDKKEWSNLNLRIPSKMLKDVDEALKDRVGISRTGWILEAIHEKLKRHTG